MAGLNVQYGAGAAGPEGWVNFDASPTLRIERAPVLGALLAKRRIFDSGVQYGDIVRGLPVAPGSAKAVYASHVLEHLSLHDAETALRNTFKILAPGGVFRLIVPSLDARTAWYEQHRGEPDAAHMFMRLCHMGLEDRPRSAAGHLRRHLGNSAHLWMWSEPAMTEALKAAGFVDIRPCRFGDAADPDFALVEAKDRFYFDEASDSREVALEARRPA